MSPRQSYCDDVTFANFLFRNLAEWLSFGRADFEDALLWIAASGALWIAEGERA
jgi:hypothetical protein